MSDSQADVTWDEVQQALYKQILKAANETTQSKNLLRLAEAFAWATAQAQPHGSSAGTD